MCGALGALVFTGAPSARAQPHPVAHYEADRLEGHTGDAFEVALTVQWTGPADALDVPVPRPVDTPGLRFHMLGSESRQDGERSHVRFRWRVAAQQPDTFTIDDLVPAVVYPPDSSTPVTLRATAPLRIHVAPRASVWRWAGAGLGGAAACGAVLAAARVITRRRTARREAAAHAAAQHAAHTHHEAAFANAVRQRTEGHYTAYLDGLLTLAAQCAAPAATADELRALRERVAFGSYQPTTHELERAAALVARLLHTDHPSPTTEEESA